MRHMSGTGACAGHAPDGLPDLYLAHKLGAGLIVGGTKPAVPDRHLSVLAGSLRFTRRKGPAPPVPCADANLLMEATAVSKVLA
jgi:hypothetical protein